MRSHAVLLVIVTISLAATSSLAMPKLSREITGQVSEVDEEKKIISIVSLGTKELRSFYWNKRTEFWEGSNKGDPKSLKSGFLVEVRYKSPLFTEPFVTKVSWSKTPHYKAP